MIRLEDYTIYRAFLALLWSNSRGVRLDKQVGTDISMQCTDNWGQSYNYQSNGREKYKHTMEAVNVITGNHNIRELMGTGSMNDLIDELGMGIYGTYLKGSEHDADLVDTIVKTLKRNRTSNVLGGKNLDRLRKAVLIPDELIGLKERIKKNDLSCGECGIELVHGEMLTILGDGEGQSIVVCGACAGPKQIQNTNRKLGKVNIPIELSNTIRDLKKQVKVEEKEEVHIPDAASEANLNRVIEDLRAISNPFPTSEDQDDDEDSELDPDEDFDEPEDFDEIDERRAATLNAAPTPTPSWSVDATNWGGQSPTIQSPDFLTAVRQEQERISREMMEREERTMIWEGSGVANPVQNRAVSTRLQDAARRYEGVQWHSVQDSIFGEVQAPTRMTTPPATLTTTAGTGEPGYRTMYYVENPGRNIRVDGLLENGSEIRFVGEDSFIGEDSAPTPIILPSDDPIIEEL